MPQVHHGTIKLDERKHPAPGSPSSLQASPAGESPPPSSSYKLQGGWALLTEEAPEPTITGRR